MPPRTPPTRSRLDTVALVLLAFGFEYREKPSNLRFAREDDWREVFAAYFPSKRFAVVGAHVDLGRDEIVYQ